MSIKLGAFGFQCSCKYVKLYVSVLETRFSVLSAGAEKGGQGHAPRCHCNSGSCESQAVGLGLSLPSA